MSDADYASFLDKANQDSGGDASAQQQSDKKSYGTKSVNTSVPSALQNVKEVYTSDADEPFEPVSLEFGGGSLDAGKSDQTFGLGVKWALGSRIVCFTVLTLMPQMS
jgi:hypothetical protein